MTTDSLTPSRLVFQSGLDFLYRRFLARFGPRPEWQQPAEPPASAEIEQSIKDEFSRIEILQAEWDALAAIPPAELWDELPPYPYSRLGRWLWQKFGGGLVEPLPAWVETYELYYRRLEREAEELSRWEQQQADWAALMEEYQVQGEHMAEMLPLYLHNLRLSYRRTVQDRKTERHYERVDYCLIDSWYFDESAYYFWVNTWDALPWGLNIKMFLEPEIKDTLSVNFGSECYVENNQREHQRPGLWIVVMHKAGKGLVPKMVHYSDMLKTMPQSAPPLAFPVGLGRNGKYHYGDMDELITILIVGSRGAGKSNTINCILNTWLNRVGPAQLRLFLTDLKGGLEFYDYHGIPHLGGDVDIKMRLGKDQPLAPARLGQDIMTDPPQVVPCLKYIEAEMERRFEIMKGKAKKITAYNRKFKDKLSYWVLVIDELATLMDSSQKTEAASSLSELARKGRAVGIYLVLATQIPDKTVLTRQVAGNMDCRIVGRVADGPSSALSLGDGSWDAVYLPKDIPGRMIWRWSDKVVLQTPYIPDLTIKQTIARLRSGQAAAPADAAEQAQAMELFGYAMEFLGGLCKRAELYNHFKTRMSEYTIRGLLSKFEVRLNDGSFGPIIHMGETGDYFLAPPWQEGKKGKMPYQLIEIDQFKADKKWLEIVSRRNGYGVKGDKNPEQVTGKDSKLFKISNPEQANEPTPPIAVWTYDPPDDEPDISQADDAEAVSAEAWQEDDDSWQNREGDY